MRYIFAFLLSYSFTIVFAQETKAIGEWESYLPYNTGSWVTQSPTSIIYSTPWSLLTIDKDDSSVQFISKTDGLNDVGISRVAYDEFTGQLVVIYTNSNIDIVDGEDVFNLSDIQNNLTIQGDKSINHVFLDGLGNAYLSTPFGIVILNLIDLEFGATIFTDIEIDQVQVVGDQLYAATEEGLYTIQNGGSLNIRDFSSWTLLDDSNGLPTLESIINLSSFAGKLYASTSTKVYSGNKDFLSEVFTTENGERVQYMSENLGYLMIGLRNQSTFRARTIYVNAAEEQVEGGADCINRVLYGITDEQGRSWYADEWEEIRYTESITSGCKKLSYNGPKSHTASDISIRDGEVYYASGGVDDGWQYLNTRVGFYGISDSKWTNYNQDNVDLIRSAELINIFAIEADPKSDYIYAGSYYSGLMKFDPNTGSAELFDKDNTSLGGAVGDGDRTRISGLEFDDDNNLWISNFVAEKPLTVLTNEGVFHSFSAATSNTSLEEIAIDDNDYKWIIAGGTSGGVMVYHEGESIENPGDDQKVFFNLNNSEISTNLVYSVAVDLDGDVWVGTAEGPVVFECGASVFENTDCRGSRRKVLQDSIAALLLETEEIRTIAVDGANRKWFGTRRGIFVQSPDGETQVGRYTIDNSPLFDDVVNKLAYDKESGKMHIATDKGMQSIRTRTTGGSRRHEPGEVYAFPNPVRPEYTGEIAIKGLATDANVKITDLNGRLVFETTALGGQAMWNGNDYSGNRASTGVYLVFSSASVGFDEVDSYVSKILFIE